MAAPMRKDRVHGGDPHGQTWFYMGVLRHTVLPQASQLRCLSCHQLHVSRHPSSLKNLHKKTMILPRIRTRLLSQEVSCYLPRRQASTNFHCCNRRHEQASTNFHCCNTRHEQASTALTNFHFCNPRHEQASTGFINFNFCNMRPQQFSRSSRIFSSDRTVLLRTLPFAMSEDASRLVCRRHVSTEASAPTPSSGWYVDMFGPESPPVRLAMTLLEHVHLHTGLPWWATIVMTTVALRLGLTFPLAVYQAHVIARVEGLQPELARFAAALRRQVAVAGHQRGWSEKQMRSKFNVKAMSLYWTSSSAVGLAQNILLKLPWLRQACRIPPTPRDSPTPFRDMAASPDMVSQGALWFTDLTAADPTLLLPVMLGTLNLVIVEAMSLYWTSSSAVGLAQNILLKLPWLRQACRIPPTPRDSPTPFRDMAASVRQKLRRETRKPPAKS
uniref:Mitochondrial inner membrane protein COX18 n=1 Tax=Branchiostoma floridae TaxID=7739 RepID=C3YP10_BRAFL|eukprot:XP_002601889.1 hypothetical protein BRAFLDRAFT_86367 [Branchiostoma floridae]